MLANPICIKSKRIRKRRETIVNQTCVNRLRSRGRNVATNAEALAPQQLKIVVDSDGEQQYSHHLLAKQLAIPLKAQELDFEIADRSSSLFF
jgi:hypothetical protein